MQQQGPKAVHDAGTCQTHKLLNSQTRHVQMRNLRDLREHELQGSAGPAKREGNANSHDHGQSHRSSAWTLNLDQYDVDALSNDLVMRREDLLKRLQVRWNWWDAPLLLTRQHEKRGRHIAIEPHGH